LEGLEETIIARLIDRAQFHRNAAAYQRGRSGFAGEPELSLFALRMRYQEEMDARFGRFEVPEERPFNRNLPPPRRQVRLPETGLKLTDYDRVNLTDRILAAYLDLLPGICPPGDDAQYGSSVEHDVYAVQAISRRIHYGAMYVAEAKYRSDPAAYAPAVAAGDAERLGALLTRSDVEERILLRVHVKAGMMQASAKAETRITIHPDRVRAFYADHVIPLTKAGEIRYLRHRHP
jgi:chorismate mutase